MVATHLGVVAPLCGRTGWARAHHTASRALAAESGVAAASERAQQWVAAGGLVHRHQRGILARPQALHFHHTAQRRRRQPSGRRRRCRAPPGARGCVREGRQAACITV